MDVVEWDDAAALGGDATYGWLRRERCRGWSALPSVLDVDGGCLGTRGKVWRAVTDEERAAVEGAKEGDPRAWARLVRLYGPYTWYLCRTCMRGAVPEDLEDTVQEIWLQVYQHIRSQRGSDQSGDPQHPDDGQPPTERDDQSDNSQAAGDRPPSDPTEQFKSWLRVVTLRTAWRCNRQRAVRARREEIGGLVDDPGDSLWFQDYKVVLDRVLIRWALEQIEPSYRMPLLLAATGLTYAEIAKEISVTEAVVRARLYRARRALKELLQDLTGSGGEAW